MQTKGLFSRKTDDWATMIEKNKIYLGDAYQLIKHVQDKTVDLIVTDPPYLIEDLHISNTPFGKRQYINEMKDANLGGSIDMRRILPEFVRVMKMVNCYIWCNKEQIYDYITFFVKELGCNWEIIVWAKTNPSPYCSTHYLKDKEYCLYFWESGIKLKPTFETGKTVYLTPTNVEDKKKYLHPTIKPEPIIANLILNSCPDGGIVLDPFSGSGTTCAVAKRLGFDYIGFEIDPKYHGIAVDRLSGITQQGRNSYSNQMSIFDFIGDDDNDQG